MSASITTAQHTLHQIADLVAAGFSPPASEAPEGRAARTAATLREEGDLAGDLPLTLGDAVLALRLLADPLPDDPPGAVPGRRATCAEIAALIQPVPADGNPLHLAAVYRRVELRLHDATDAQGEVDPRRRAIATRAGREAAELEQSQSYYGVRGTLTYRPDCSDWLLQLDRIAKVVAAAPPPINSDGWVAGAQLLPLVQPHVEHLLVGPRIEIAIVEPDGVDTIGQRPPGGLILAYLSSYDGELHVNVPRSVQLV